jgi:flagella basal body P-ring formation protein FlgA
MSKLLRLLPLLFAMTMCVQQALAVSSDEISTAAKAAVYSALPWPDEDIVIEPAGDVDAVTSSEDAVAVPVSCDTSLFPAPLPTRVDIVVNGMVERSLVVKCRVRLYKTMAQAAHLIERGHVFAPTDVVFMRRELQSLQQTGINAFDGLEGCRSRARILPGRLISNDLVEKIPLIRRGEKVAIEASSDNCSVSVQGVAQEDGTAGEYIKVANLSSRKLLIAEIVGPGRVTLQPQQR